MHSHPTHLDRSIQATSQDAIRAKAAAVSSGYYQDPFVSHYLPAASPLPTLGMTPGNGLSRLGSPPPTANRRPPVQPIIKRGTHARVACMDRAIAAFLNLFADRFDDMEGVQVVILGAGKDTTFCRLQADLLLTPVTPLPSSCSLRWFEIDHEVIVREKAANILDKPNVFPLKLSGQTDNAATFEFKMADSKKSSCQNASYHLVSHDLRNDPNHLMGHLKAIGLNEALPTLFVMECVQMYLPESSSQTLLRCISDLSQSFLILYEPILGNDPFGRVMETNLKAAGVAHEDSCLVKTRTLSQHLQKLQQVGKGDDGTAGFTLATGCDMWSAYETIITLEQRQKANKCEFLDELEEWVMIMKHYCFIAAASASTGATGRSFCSIGESSPVGFLKGKCETL